MVLKLTLLMVFNLSLIILGGLLASINYLFAARFFEIPAEELAIGLGPRIWSWKLKSMILSLRLFPIGVFLKRDKRVLKTKPWYARLILGIHRVLAFFSAVHSSFLLVSYIVSILSAYIYGQLSPVIGTLR